MVSNEELFRRNRNNDPKNLVREPSNLQRELPKRVSYLVWLKIPGLWLGAGAGMNKWVERRDQAERFPNFKAADDASSGYDVRIIAEES